ncbi:MAG: helix-turn-helix domain-containing protein [Deltaproteobacteria bacterium]|nr:MAG: helix-turn-helix domain-containing protein [Deltaproteobacteria bacterium]
MERTFSTDEAADYLGVKASQLYDLARARYVDPQRHGVAIHWSERDLAIAGLVVFMISAGIPAYAARMVSQRLDPLKTSADVEAAAAKMALVERDGLFRLSDAALDHKALTIARNARRAGARVLFLRTNPEEN